MHKIGPQKDFMEKIRKAQAKVEKELGVKVIENQSDTNNSDRDKNSQKNEKVIPLFPQSYE